jgi:hypothetical protein
LAAFCAPVVANLLLLRDVMRMTDCRTFAAIGIGLIMTATAVAGVGRLDSRGPQPGSRAAGAIAPRLGSSAMAQALADRPVAFVENRGQIDPRVRYYAQGDRFAFYLTQREIVLALMRRPPAHPHVTSPSPARATDDFAVSAAGHALDGHAVALRFIGAKTDAAIDGERASGTINVLAGDDPSRWHTGLSRFSEMTYRGLWPGIDLHVREQAGTLKYEFHVAPGADPSAIGLAYDGASGLTIDPSGALRIGTTLGPLRDAAPISYQLVGGTRVAVSSRYVVSDVGGERRVGFAVDAHRPDRPLVIDPGIDYSTFIGGASHEMPGGVAVDAAGNVYVAGFTQSPNFPTTAGAFRRTGAVSNFSDVFVTKLNPAGTALIYSTFVGGSDFDFGRRIAIDAAGNAYVTGQTKSSNFPTTSGAFDRSFNILSCPRCGIDQYDSFVFKLNAAGSALVYSTFLGGTDIDSARGIAVDGSGNAYVTGETTSSDFPTTAGAYRRVYAGSYDAFVTKLNASGSALVYSTFLGGANVDNAERIAVDGSGRAHVAGFTSSTDFPTTAGAFDTTPNGGFDIFVTRLNAAGSALAYSTLLGGSGSDSAGGLVLDATGSAYVSGGTGSVDFPTTPGAFDTTSDGSDAFIAKLNPAGSALTFSTVLGGSGGDGASGVTVDPGGNVWVTGGTNSPDFPVTAITAQPTFRGVSDAFVSQVRLDGSALLYSTFLGGVNGDGGDDVASDPTGDIYVAGHTYSLDFPATVGAFDTIFNGDTSIFWGDAFVTRIATDTNTSTPPADAPVPPAPVLLSPVNGDAPPQPITFDWNDAQGAASYTIQIDDSNTFAPPLIREGSVTTSMYATTGLSPATHFWRVRGVNVNGVAGAWSAVRSLTPQPPPPPATLATIDTNPSTVAGGTSSSGTVVLSVGAPDGGALIRLTSSHPAIAGVPATVTVPANGFAGTFVISTAPVAANTTVTITADYNGTARAATLTVTSAATPVWVQALILGSSTITGGSGMQGVVRLSGSAPSGGAVVSLVSSRPTAAGVPSSVTVPAGATTGVFNVSTAAVTASTVVTISASYGGATATSDLTVTPPAPQPQPATLSVTATGRSGVRVRSSPAGIDVPTGSSASASFTVGTAITLSMTDGRDAVFSGACSSGNKVKSCTFTLNGASSVTVNVQ